MCYAAGLVNYSVPAGEAHFKALEIAREINQKVQVYALWIIFFTVQKHFVGNQISNTVPGS